MQKSALKSVNVQRTGKSILQFFAFFLTAAIFNFVFFRHDSAEFKLAWLFSRCSVICRFLPILLPPTVHRSHFRNTRTKAFTLIISHFTDSKLLRRKVDSAWYSKFKPSRRLLATNPIVFSGIKFSYHYTLENCTSIVNLHACYAYWLRDSKTKR